MCSMLGGAFLSELHGHTKIVDAHAEDKGGHSIAGAFPPTRYALQAQEALLDGIQGRDVEHVQQPRDQGGMNPALIAGPFVVLAEIAQKKLKEIFVAHVLVLSRVGMAKAPAGAGA